ncbi:MAG: hypothetical protein IPO18_19445 [bacterium]|nr:hypothetical protein [bacterium]
MMPAAAARISRPSVVLEKYSALPCPYVWPLSAGRAAIVSMANAMKPATRLTTDSTASDRKPTELVNR